MPSLVFLYPLYPLYPLCPPYPLDSLDSLAYSTYLLKDFFLKWRPGRRPLANDRRLGCIAIQQAFLMQVASFPVTMMPGTVLARQANCLQCLATTKT